MKKIGMMATYPARRDSLLECLPTILPQLDTLYIYANQYDISALSKTSRIIAEMSKTCNVKIIDPVFGHGDVKDMGKFWALNSVRGYVFLLDDDLLYPPDYCRTHIKFIEKHKQVSTVHGRFIKEFPLHSYFGNTDSLNYKRAVSTPTVLHIAGTGTVAFSTRYMDALQPVSELTMKKFMGMADIYFACLINQKGKKIIAVPREERWLTDTRKSIGTVSLYVRTRNHTRQHCKRLNAMSWSL